VVCVVCVCVCGNLTSVCERRLMCGEKVAATGARESLRRFDL